MAILLLIYMMRDISAMQWWSTKRKSDMHSFCGAESACCAHVHFLQCSGAAHRHSHQENDAGWVNAACENQQTLNTVVRTRPCVWQNECLCGTYLDCLCGAETMNLDCLCGTGGKERSSFCGAGLTKRITYHIEHSHSPQHTEQLFQDIPSTSQFYAP